jgi:hypothetical protein
MAYDIELMSIGEDLYTLLGDSAAIAELGAAGV